MGCELCLRAESPPFVLASPTYSFKKRIGVVEWNGPGQSFRLTFILLGESVSPSAEPSRQSNVGVKYIASSVVKVRRAWILRRAKVLGHGTCT
jgi:hypothetical protein